MLIQRQSTALRPLTTAHLAQTMSLLELNTVELRQKIEAELARNPALELVDERRCPCCGRPMPSRGACPMCSQPKTGLLEEPIVFLSTRDEFYRQDGSFAAEEDLPEENFGSQGETLAAFVLKQIAPELDPQDRPIAAHLLTSLDEDGLLGVSLVEVARYYHVPISRVETVQHLIQRAEPYGVGSRTPQEALLVQIEVLGETRPVPPMALRVINEGFDLLSHRRFIDLGRLLNISTSQAKEIARFIGDNLNPFPARSHWGEANSRMPENSTSTRTYYFPDIIISRLTEDEHTPLVVEIALPIQGTLRINPQFREALHHAPEEKEDGWRKDLDQAALLVKCIQQRNHTIVRLMQRLVVLQRQFILHGDECLLPLTRASLSEELGVHEATVSRAVSDKAVQIPNGHIIPLARFFDRSLHIRTLLRKIIDMEMVPLSDADLAIKLKGNGYPVARRTVAKYRTMEGILPAHLRLKSNPD